MDILASLAIRRLALARLARLAGAVAALTTLTALTACGAVPAHPSTSRDGPQGVVSLACATTVHGVVEGAGSLTAAWLPPGYRLQGGATPTSLPASTYDKATGQPDPPRIMLTSGHQAGPVTGADGGAGRGTMVRIQGHRGLIESGPPAPQLAGVYWKPSAGFLLSVVGYKVPRSVLLRVARHVSFAAPGVVPLTVAPGRIVARQAAIAAAERATGARWRHATAKLSSWTEVAAVAMHARAPRAQQILTTPPGLAGSPWRPVWVVLLTGPAPATAAPTAVVMDAASGQVEDSIHVYGPWFAVLTDRDAASGRCPGGSSARVPFGVLTRDEEEYQADSQLAVAHASTTVRYILSTIPAVNKAEPGLYGGCIQQDCSIGQLVWVTIVTVHARADQKIPCLPAFSGPAGYKPRQVQQYYSVSVPDNVGAACGPEPARLANLRDLAPPAQPQSA